MKKVRFLLGTMILGAVVAVASLGQNHLPSAGADPIPVCPPDGCVIN